MIESLLKAAVFDREMAAQTAGTDDTLNGDILDLHRGSPAAGGISGGGARSSCL